MKVFQMPWAKPLAQQWTPCASASPALEEHTRSFWTGPEALVKGAFAYQTNLNQGFSRGSLQMPPNPHKLPQDHLIKCLAGLLPMLHRTLLVSFEPLLLQIHLTACGFLHWKKQRGVTPDLPPNCQWELSLQIMLQNWLTFPVSLLFK